MIKYFAKHIQYPHKNTAIFNAKFTIFMNWKEFFILKHLEMWYDKWTVNITKVLLKYFCIVLGYKLCNVIPYHYFIQLVTFDEVNERKYLWHCGMSCMKFTCQRERYRSFKWYVILINIYNRSLMLKIHDAI